MSRTYKRCPRRVVRAMRGNKQALINGARRGAVPPSVNKDYNHDSHCYIPFVIAEKMFKSGKELHAIIGHLMKKFKITYQEAYLCLPVKAKKDKLGRKIKI